MSDHVHTDAQPPTPEPGVTGEEFWDGRYRENDRIWSGEANVALVREAADLAPGRALDLGCGEGGDAVWLARRGWRVTATDISGVALERAASHAADAGVGDRVEWQRHDFAHSFPAASTTWSPPASCTRTGTSRASGSCAGRPPPWPPAESC